LHFAVHKFRHLMPKKYKGAMFYAVVISWRSAFNKNRLYSWKYMNQSAVHYTTPNPTASYIQQAWLHNFKLLLKGYHDEVNEVSNIPKKCGRSLLGQDGVLSKLFFLYLFQDHKGIKFLQESRLPRSNMTCSKFNINMTFSKNDCVIDKGRWRCCKVRTDYCTGRRSRYHSI
jgi:hypothetical protein